MKLSSYNHTSHQANNKQLTTNNSYLSKYWPILLIILIELILFFTNYTPGTYLVGWDNLFPEFNFPLNFQRTIFAIWQEYRGLGLLDGMSHAANLIHHLTVFTLSIFAPQSSLRYIFIHLTHLGGGLGMYFLLNKLLSHKPTTNNSFTLRIGGQLTTNNLQLTTLTGSLFYMLNLTTVQMYYLPFETFIVHFAALPWTFLTLNNFLKSPTKKNALLLGLTSLLATPQAHVPTVFLVFTMAVASFLLTRLIQHKGRGLSPMLLAIWIFFFTNSFWGIPYIYSTINQAPKIAASKDNQMATDDIFYRNQNYADLESTAKLYSHILDFAHYNPDTKVTEYIMGNWRKHLGNGLVNIIQWSFFAITLYGAYQIIRKRNGSLYPYLVIFIFTFSMLGSQIPGVSIVSSTLRSSIPFFHDVFRDTFTKFSLIYVFTYAILLTYALQSLSQKNNPLAKLDHYADFQKILPITALLAILIYTLPAFQGYFTHKYLRVKIPQDYFQTFAFFRSVDPHTRISTFPLPWHWSWIQTDWSTITAGFIWHGLPQSITQLAFDKWNNYNEEYYWEITEALYTQNPTRFSKVLEKYHINWILIDPHIIHVSLPNSLYNQKLKEMLTQIPEVKIEKTFGKIQIYKVQHNQNAQKYISIYQNLPEIKPLYNWNNNDQAYLDYGPYISQPTNSYPTTNNSQLTTNNSQLTTNNSQPITAFYPFRSLFTNRLQEELEFDITEEGDQFVFSTKIPTYNQQPTTNNLQLTTLSIPALLPDDVISIDTENIHNTPIVVLDGETIPYDKTGANITLSYIKEGQLQIRVPKVPEDYSFDTQNYPEDVRSKEPVRCNDFKKGTASFEYVYKLSKTNILLSTQDSNYCVDFYLPYLLQRFGYLTLVESKNIAGKSLIFSIVNNNSTRSDLETLLPKNPQTTVSYFIQPPMEQNAYSYSLHFDNESIGPKTATNEIGRVAIYPIPYHFLTNLKIINPNQFTLSEAEGQLTTNNLQPITYNLQPSSVSHPNPSSYTILTPLLTEQNRSTLVLAQAYDPGWKAYEINCLSATKGLDCTLQKMFPFAFGKELKNHVLVNNWANGWTLQPTTNLPSDSGGNQQLITIFYLPQLLQHLGFLLLAAGLLSILRLKKTR